MIFTVLVLVGPIANSQDTFSIVAVDTLTDEVGSAGASCVAGSIILSDVHPGIGVVHTQSFWNATNQNYARMLMNTGYSPDQIIDSLVANDAQGNPTIRQYGVVDLMDGGRSAGYTGVNCFDYKNHILGPTYAVAGNILLGQEILESMEVRFLNTGGILADRLMAALQGAKVPGADIRCLASGTSSISAFIRVARPEDTTGTFFLDLNVNNAPTGVEPIDSLQILFDEWRGGVVSVSTADLSPIGFRLKQNYPNPFNPITHIGYTIPTQQHVVMRLFDVLGREMATLVNSVHSPGDYILEWDGRTIPGGVYFYRLQSGTFTATRKLLLLR